MSQFYLIIEKGATLSHQLTRSHYCELLSIKDFICMIKRCSTATPIALSYDQILFVIRKIAPLAQQLLYSLFTTQLLQRSLL